MLQKLKDNLIPIIIVAVLVGGGATMFMDRGSVNSAAGSSDVPTIIKVSVPELTPLGKLGQEAFEDNCSACHGNNAGGSENGPPLIHSIYNPGHHPDGAFLAAAKNGVQSHHWGFGNMPPLEGVSKRDVLLVVRFIRELQQANGIKTQAHNM